MDRYADLLLWRPQQISDVAANQLLSAPEDSLDAE